MTSLRDPFDNVHKKDIKNKQGQVVAQVDYVGWSQSADRLDEAEGVAWWSFTIMALGPDWAHGRLTIGDGNALLRERRLRRERRHGLEEGTAQGRGVGRASSAAPPSPASAATCTTRTSRALRATLRPPSARRRLHGRTSSTRRWQTSRTRTGYRLRTRRHRDPAGRT
jgi:hypothetical protein